MSSSKRDSKESQEFKVPPKFKFQEGEKVLCFHGPLIYEAKCLQSRYSEKDKVNEYHIHYSGWNKSWDEWVPEARVLKYNDANLQKQKELHKAQKTEPKGKRSKRRSTTGKESPQVAKKDETGGISGPPGGGGAGGGSTGGGTESSRCSSPLGGSSGTVSSSQESSSDLPRRKRSRLDPSVESISQRVGGKLHTSSDFPSRWANWVIRVKRPTCSTRSEAISCVEILLNSQLSGIHIMLVLDSFLGESNGSLIDSNEEQFLAKQEVKIKLPDELKPILVDDWEYIIKQKRLVKVPHKHTVESVLADYTKQRQNTKQQVVSKEEARTEVTEGIKEYFNAMLGSRLLYKVERKQHTEVMKEQPDTPPSKLYGPIHLLRLFVKIGCALAYTRLDERTVQVLVLHLHDFLKFLQRQSATYFSPQDYTAPVA